MDLEKEIHSINQQLLAMGIDIAKINERNNSYSKEKDELTRVVKALEETINSLNNTLAKKDGIQEGKSTAFKGTWGVVGGLFILWILWVTNGIVNNTYDIKSLQKDSDSKRGSLKNEP